MRVGIVPHLGWAVVVTADDDHAVRDRRRIALVDPDLPAAPIHHLGGTWAMHTDEPPPSDDELAALVDRVRSSVRACATEALERLAADLVDQHGPDATLVSVSVRSWPTGLPTDITALRRVPYESRADAAMYGEVLAEVAGARGVEVHTFDPKTVEAVAIDLLGADGDTILATPRATLGPPWTKEHRDALAATVLAARAGATTPP